MISLGLFGVFSWGNELFAQLGWEFDHGDHEISISASGMLLREEEILFLTPAGNGTVDILSQSISFTVMEGHGLLLGREVSPTESVLRVITKRPTSLTNAEVAGDWVLVQFLIEENDGGVDIHAFETFSADITIDEDGSFTVSTGSDGTYTIDTRRHMIVSLEGEVFDFGVIDSKDMMVTTSSAAGTHLMLMLFRLESGGLTSQLKGPWTLHSFTVDGGIPSHSFSKEDFDVLANGSASMYDGPLSLSADGNGRVTWSQGSDLGQLIWSQSRNLLVYAFSAFTEHELALVVRRPSNLILANLAGTWDVYEIEISGAAETGDSDGDGLPDVWEMVNFGSRDEDGHGDWDKDGYSDLFEYLTQSSPRNPTIFETSLVPDLSWEGNYILWFPTVSGRIYIIQTRSLPRRHA